MLRAVIDNGIHVRGVHKMAERTHSLPKVPVAQPRGYFGIGVQNGKTEINLGTLWRSAHSFGAAFIFTVGGRYRCQPSDTTKAERHIPLYQYDSLTDFGISVPLAAKIIGVEMMDGARPLHKFQHPERALYVLGAEDWGLSSEMLRLCTDVVILPGVRCINVAVAGSIVMYDRLAKCARLGGD